MFRGLRPSRTGRLNATSAPRRLLALAAPVGGIATLALGLIWSGCEDGVEVARWLGMNGEDVARWRGGPGWRHGIR